jgi:hypothetical protein
LRLQHQDTSIRLPNLGKPGPSMSMSMTQTSR